MPYKSEKIKLDPSQDRRRKLTDEQKEEIKQIYKSGVCGTRPLAKQFGVSRRTIQFIVDEEKKQRCAEQFKQRRKDGRYKPTKEEWARTVREHRRYKQKLYLNGELQEESK
jgi:ribosomal protein L19E